MGTHATTVQIINNKERPSRKVQTKTKNITLVGDTTRNNSPPEIYTHPQRHTLYKKKRQEKKKHTSVNATYALVSLPCPQPPSHQNNRDIKIHLGHGLGGAGGRRDDVGGRAASPAPVLLRGTVHHHLGGGHGVHGGHQGLLDTEVVVDDLHGRGEPVGGAGRARYEVHGRVVRLGVDAHHDGVGVVLGRGGEDDLLGAGLQVGLDLLLGEEGAGGLADVLGAGGREGDLLRVAGVGGGHALAVEDEVHAVNLHGAGEASVDRVVLELFL